MTIPNGLHLMIATAHLFPRIVPYQLHMYLHTCLDPMNWVWWLQNPIPHMTIPSGLHLVDYTDSSPAHIYQCQWVRISLVFSVHVTFLSRGTPWKNWFHWTFQAIIHSTINGEVCWPACWFHLSRTHDRDDDEELSKDIVTGQQGRRQHCPEFLQIHWGSSLVKFLSLAALLMFHGIADILTKLVLLLLSMFSSLH